MVLRNVQRSGRTTILATTRSLSASMNVTPFNSAKGIFIPRIFSSSDIDPPGLLFARLLLTGWTAQVNQAMTSEVMAAVTRRRSLEENPANAPVPSPPDCLPHRRDGGDALSARRTGPH